jgi:FixJ family two-component response regulator
MDKATCKIFIIDDDPSVRRSFTLLIKSAGYDAETYKSAEEFLELEDHAGEGCILLDIFMDGKSGLELQEEIRKRFSCLPIIYITGLGDIPMSVRALRKGAVNFLQKPVDEKLLLDAVQEAVNTSGEMYQKQEETNQIRSLVNSLTPREYQVFRCLVTGMLNKQIASELDIAEHTVKLHRGKITEKLGMKSVAELVKLAQKINL